MTSTSPDRHQVHQARGHENPSRFRCSPRGNFARNALGVHHRRPVRAAAIVGGKGGGAAQNPAGRRAREDADHDATLRYTATPFTEIASRKTRHKFMLELGFLDCFWWPDTPDGAARPTETRPPMTRTGAVKVVLSGHDGDTPRTRQLIKILRRIRGFRDIREIAKAWTISLLQSPGPEPAGRHSQA